MRRKVGYALLAAAALAAFVLAQTLFVARAGQAVVVTTFGKPSGDAITEPGLYAHWPWPIQKIHVFDARLQCLNGTFEETYTRDHKNVIVMLYMGWRIANPIRFLERVGSERQAEANLESLLRNYKNAVFGQHDFADFVNTNSALLKFEQAESEMLEPVRSEAAERYGIAVEFVGIRKLALPEAITARVFDRMRSERKAMAERYRAEGEAEAARIRAEADRARQETLAEAEAQAKRIRADGDAEAARYYAVFEKNPDLAVFLRKLDALEHTLDGKTVVVLGADTIPYDLLNASPATNAVRPSEAARN